MPLTAALDFCWDLSLLGADLKRVSSDLVSFFSRAILVLKSYLELVLVTMYGMLVTLGVVTSTLGCRASFILAAIFDCVVRMTDRALKVLNLSGIALLLGLLTLWARTHAAAWSTLSCVKETLRPTLEFVKAALPSANSLICSLLGRIGEARAHIVSAFKVLAKAIDYVLTAAHVEELEVDEGVAIAAWPPSPTRVDGAKKRRATQKAVRRRWRCYISRRCTVPIVTTTATAKTPPETGTAPFGQPAANSSGLKSSFSIRSAISSHVEGACP